METIQDKISITTIRLNNSDFPNPVNYGLECYLCEASLKLEDENLIEEIKQSIKKITTQKQIYKGKAFWGWEVAPSIKNIFFPLDWDDTCKAVDVISLAFKNNIISESEFKEINLPDSKLWQEEIKNSLFETKTIGEDYILETRHTQALTVFFGKHSENWKFRDDPMVSLVTIKTTYLWYNDVFQNLKVDFIELTKRLIFTYNSIVQNGKLKFEHISRYYFSFGHFAFRLFELLELIEDKSLNDYIDWQNTTAIFSTLNNEDKLWFSLIFRKYNIKEISYFYFFDTLEKLDNNQPIYRHRRLNHLYGAKDWTKRLLIIESELLKTN